MLARQIDIADKIIDVTKIISENSVVGIEFDCSFHIANGHIVSMRFDCQRAHQVKRHGIVGLLAEDGLVAKLCFAEEISPLKVDTAL
jgi:hypothetical protein